MLGGKPAPPLGDWYWSAAGLQRSSEKGQPACDSPAAFDWTRSQQRLRSWCFTFYRYPPSQQNTAEHLAGLSATPAPLRVAPMGWRSKLQKTGTMVLPNGETPLPPPTSRTRALQNPDPPWVVLIRPIHSGRGRVREPFRGSIVAVVRGRMDRRGNMLRLFPRCIGRAGYENTYREGAHATCPALACAVHAAVGVVGSSTGSAGMHSARLTSFEHLPHYGCTTCGSCPAVCALPKVPTLRYL